MSTPQNFIFYFSRIRNEERRSHHLEQNATITDAAQSFNYSKESGWPTEMYVYVYSGIMVLFLLTTVARSAIFYNFCMAAAQNMHDSMFRRLISTTMRFFDMNPAGRILNRFTKDLGYLDGTFPPLLFITIQVNFRIIGIMMVTMYTDTKLSLVIVVMGAMLVPLQNIYFNSTKNIQRLEATSMSHHLQIPVIDHEQFQHISNYLSFFSEVSSFHPYIIFIERPIHDQGIQSRKYFTIRI